jgi:hypothetical protein
MSFSLPAAKMLFHAIQLLLALIFSLRVFDGLVSAVPLHFPGPRTRKLDLSGRLTFSEVRNSDELEVRQVNGTVPSVEECKANLNVPQPNSTVFYTGGTHDDAQEFSGLIGGSTMDDLLQYDITQPPYTTWDTDQTEEFWTHCSQALAEITSGEAFVVMPLDMTAAGNGTTVFQGTIVNDGGVNFWQVAEYPNLIINIDVFLITKAVKVGLGNFSTSQLWPCASASGNEFNCPDSGSSSGTPSV